MDTRRKEDTRRKDPTTRKRDRNEGEDAREDALPLTKKYKISEEMPNTTNALTSDTDSNSSDAEYARELKIEDACKQRYLLFSQLSLRPDQASCFETAAIVLESLLTTVSRIHDYGKCEQHFVWNRVYSEVRESYDLTVDFQKSMLTLLDTLMPRLRRNTKLTAMKTTEMETKLRVDVSSTVRNLITVRDAMLAFPPVIQEFKEVSEEFDKLNKSRTLSSDQVKLFNSMVEKKMPTLKGMVEQLSDLIPRLQSIESYDSRRVPVKA
jgi:hypothetical protein